MGGLGSQGTTFPSSMEGAHGGESAATCGGGDLGAPV